VPLHVLALEVDLRLIDSRSLKDKRSILRPILDGSKRRFSVSVAETDHQDEWRRSTLAFCAVSSSTGLVTKVLDDVERFVWSFPEVEVLDAQRHWLETD